MRRIRYGWLVLVVTGVLAAGCVMVPALEPQRSWTPLPITARPAGTRQSGATPLGAGQATAGSDATPTAPPPTRAPTRAPSPTLAQNPSPDPHIAVITEEEIRQSVATGAAEQGGAQVKGLDVRFSGGKMHLTAQQLKYGVVNVRNLEVVGRLFADQGQLQMAVESVQPGGLVGAFIPAVVNQVLGQYASRWYVEDVQTLDGRLELRIR
jgi:hypothetical protein